jgi:hypothetical protein
VRWDPAAPWSCRIHAASLVADRAFGRAPQSVSLEVTRRLSDLTLDELRQLEARLAAEQLTIDADACGGYLVRQQPNNIKALVLYLLCTHAHTHARPIGRPYF